MESGTSIAWDDVLKKEARGTDDSDFGEVQEVGPNYVTTQRGIVNKDKFYIPKYMVEGYDGDTLWFNAREGDLQGVMRDEPPSYEEYSRYRTTETPSDIETRIPVIEERLEVTKRVSTDEATITKEPVTETRTMEVPVTHEELRVERRPASREATESERVAQSRSEIKVPLTKEEVEVTKRPYVKEEVVVTKEPVTETETVTDTVTSEKVDTGDLRKRRTRAS